MNKLKRVADWRLKISLIVEFRIRKGFTVFIYIFYTSRAYWVNTILTSNVYRFFWFKCNMNHQYMTFTLIRYSIILYWNTYLVSKSKVIYWGYVHVWLLYACHYYLWKFYGWEVFKLTQIIIRLGRGGTISLTE